MDAVAKCSGHLVEGSKELITMDKIVGIIFLRANCIRVKSGADKILLITEEHTGLLATKDFKYSYGSFRLLAKGAVEK